MNDSEHIHVSSKDIAGLDAMMADDYVLVHMTGKRQDNMFARSFASYRLKMHLTVEAIEEKPLIFLHSKRAIT